MSVILVVMGITIFFVSQQGTGSLFDLRQRASSPNGVATLNISPADSTTHYVGDILPLDVMFATNGKGVSGVSFRYTYPVNNVMEIFDKDAAVAGAQIVSHSTDLDPSFITTVNTASPQPNGKVYVDFAATNTISGGYKNSAGQKLATMYIRAKAPGNITLTPDQDNSVATENLSGADTTGKLDVLLTVPSYNIKIAADTQAPSVKINNVFDQTDTTYTSATVAFTWTGTDAPARPDGTFVPLTYSYQFDDTAWSAFAPRPFVKATLAHGAHVLRVKAKDPSGNVSTPAAGSSIYNFTLNLTPVITTIDPTSGTIGTQVTINGTNFGAERGAGVVKFGTTAAPAADYVSWSDTKIVVKVPAGANGDIKVVRAPLVSNAMQFTLGTMLRVVFNFEGITKDQGTQPVGVWVKHGATTIAPEGNSDAVWNANQGAYMVTIGPLPETFDTANDYVVSLKDASRLRKTFTGLTLSKHAYNVIVKKDAADALRLADFNNDNKLTITDIGLMLNKFTQLSTPATDALQQFDVNGDGTFDATDIGLVLSKYTKLETPGDGL